MSAEVCTHDIPERYFRRKDDVERELEEFQENSQMLEKELETSLEQAEKTSRELRQRNTRLATEIEQLRTRLDQQSADCAMFQGKAQDLQLQHEHLLKYIRELEQKNDDLERAHRYSIHLNCKLIIISSGRRKLQYTGYLLLNVTNVTYL